MSFRPVSPVEGYLPLEDYGLIGDGDRRGTFLGNYPQAFSHIGVISSGFRRRRKST